MLDSFGEEPPRKIKCHSTIIKRIGVLLVLITCVLSGVVLIDVSHCRSKVKHVDAKPNMNQTACVYIKQYSLRDSTFAKLCHMDGQVLWTLEDLLMEVLY